jgi:hypothetical protein
MADHNDEYGPSVLIGPGIEDRGIVVEELPEPGEVPPQVEGQRLLLRLVIAFFLSVVLAAVCFVVLPANGIDVPAWIPLVAVAIIAIAALANAQAEGQLPTRGEAEGDRDGSGDGCGCGDGRPVGCCSGPRPPRFLSEPRKRR